MSNAADEKPIYRHLNIREQALDTVMQRIEQRRSRRLMAAIEFNQLKTAKIAAMREKDLVKFEKLMTKLQANLDKTRDLLEKIDNDLADATNLHNSITQMGDLL